MITTAQRTGFFIILVVGGIDEGGKSSDDLENEYEGIQNVKTIGSYNVGDDKAVCMYVCIVITYSRVWINRVRLPILLVVS